jgi:hypothetical protein
LTLALELADGSPALVVRFAHRARADGRARRNTSHPNCLDWASSGRGGRR